MRFPSWIGSASAVVAAIAFPIPANAQSATQPLPGRPFIVATNPLEESLLTFVETPSRETQIAMMRLFLTSVVYLKVPPDSPPPQLSTPGQDISPWAVVLPDGRTAVAVYTSRERLAVAFADDPLTRWVSMKGDDVLRMIGATKPIALNWGVDPSVVLGPPPEN